jgi:antitoxin YefM
MKTATFTDFRQNMREHLDGLLKDQDILVLTGPKKKDFVVLTLETFNSLEETVHLLSTTENSKRLLESMAQDRGGNATTRTPFDIQESSTGPEKNSFNGPKISH